MPQISADLLQYCPPPVSPVGLSLQAALVVVTENHEKYARCYLMQRDLVDAVKRRVK